MDQNATASAETHGRELYRRQLEYIVAGDTDRLVEENYCEDAQLVRFDRVVSGHDELKEFFRGYVDGLGSVRVKSTDNFVETDDAIFFEATVETGAYGDVRVYDAFVLDGGRIARHFTGVK